MVAFALFFTLHCVLVLLISLVVFPFVALYFIAINDRDKLRKSFSDWREAVFFPFSRLAAELSAIVSWYISDEKGRGLPFYWLDEDFDRQGGLF